MTKSANRRNRMTQGALWAATVLQALVILGSVQACKKREYNAEPETEKAAARTEPDATLFSCEMGKINFSFVYHEGVFEVNDAPINLVSVSSWKNDDASELNYRVTTGDSGEFVLHIHPGEVADEVEKVGVATPCSRDGAADTERLDKLTIKYKPVSP